MNLIRAFLLVLLVVASTLFAAAQNIVSNPTGNQTITQPIVSSVRTNLNVNSLENIRFADQFGSIQAAINDAPVGGMVMVPPGWSETLSASNNDCPLNINKSVVLRFAGSATINQGACQITVSAGANNVSIVSDFPFSSAGNGAAAGVTFEGFTGSGVAVQVGSTSADTQQFYLKGVHIDLAHAGTGAIGLQLSRVQEFAIEYPECFPGADSQICFQTDGTNSFTGVGLWLSPIISAGVNATNHVGMRFKNTSTAMQIVGGNISLIQAGTSVCFDINNSEAFFYSPNCNTANIAITVEGAGSHAGR